MEPIYINHIPVGGKSPFVLVAGPCVIESRDGVMHIARSLKEIAERLEIPFIFKASYDKANRTSIRSFRGPGEKTGLAMLAEIRRELEIPVVSDIHLPGQAAAAAEVLDVIQIPAFLCRQTDLIVAAARTGKPVNIKKGQFLAPWDMTNVVEKARDAGNARVLLTERGASFGYNNLVADMRSIPIMQETGCPVIFDATHSVQLPGGAGGASAGQRQFAPLLARAALAAGADGIFIEVHPDPDQALSDGPNSIHLETVEQMLIQFKATSQAQAQF
ncbi:MAG: 3-deoxy-8-phosphooctulonate synthase [Desulfobacterales bacterium]|nr:3-deoxy-8-phosphooctulonate synthase [Desulfobacterales bacterium]MBS3755898.1 3-deoxy-8-phosphooctulonate synthase [Desulfobacterales bacterium]